MGFGEYAMTYNPVTMKDEQETPTITYIINVHTVDGVTRTFEETVKISTNPNENTVLPTQMEYWNKVFKFGDSLHFRSREWSITIPASKIVCIGAKVKE